jgi:hypothetical protein
MRDFAAFGGEGKWDLQDKVCHASCINSLNRKLQDCTRVLEIATAVMRLIESMVCTSLKLGQLESS